MSEKSKGDTSQQSSTSSLLQQQQRIVKNPLLSANVTGLTFDDFPNKPLLLPAAPPIVKPPALLREPKSLVTVGSSSNLDSENLDEINLNAVGEQPPSSSLFAQQSAGLESSASAEANANQIWEQHSALNNDSILSQAAVSFSALPSVASSVFSTFSKRIYAGSSASSRERTPVTDTPASQANDSNQNPLQQQQQQLPPLQQQQQLPPIQQQQQVPQLKQQQLPPTFYPPPAAVRVTPHEGINPAPLLAPPPTNPEPLPAAPLEPPTFYSPSEVPTLGVAPPSQPPAAASGNTYRLSAKKKLYAPIPGLADGSQQQPFVAPLQPLEQSSFLPPQADSYGPAAFSGQDPYGGVAVQQQQQYPLEPQSAFTERRAPEERKTGGLFSLTSGVLQNLTGLVQSAAGTLTGSQTSSTPPHQQQHQQQQYSAPSAVDYFGGIAPPQPTSFTAPSEGLPGVSYPPAAVGGAPQPSGGLTEPPKATPAAFFGAGPIPLSTAPTQSQASTNLAGAPFLPPPTSTAPQQPQQATGLSTPFQPVQQPFQQPQLQQFLPPPLQPPPLLPPSLQPPSLQSPPLQPPSLQPPPVQPPPSTGETPVPTSIQSLFTPTLVGESSITAVAGGVPQQPPSASVFPPRPPSTGVQTQAPQEVQPPPTFFTPPNTNPLQTPPQPQGGAQFPPLGHHPPATATGHPPPPATGHPPPAAGSTSFRLQKGTRLYKNPLSSEETAPSYAAPPPLLGLTATPAGAQSFFNPFQGHHQQPQGDTAEEAPTTHSVPSYFIPTSSEPQSVPLFVAEDKGDTPSEEQAKGINDLLAGVKDLEIESLDTASSLAEQTIEAFVPVEEKETPTPQPAVDPLDLTLQQLAQEPQRQQAELKQQLFEPQPQIQQQIEPQQHQLQQQFEPQQQQVQHRFEPQKQQLEHQKQQFEPQQLEQQQLEPQQQQLEPQQQQLEPQQQQQFEPQQQQLQPQQQQQFEPQQQQLGQLFGQQPHQQFQQLFGQEEQQQFASHLSQQETFGQQQLPEVKKQQQQAPKAEVPQDPIPTSEEQFDSAPLPTEQPVQSVPPSTPDKPSISSLPPTGSLPPPPPPFGQSSGDTSSNPYKRKSLVGTHPPPAGPPLSTLQNFFTPITGDTGGDAGGFNFFATPPTTRQDEPVAAAPPVDPINFFQPSAAAEPRPSAPSLPQFVETPIEAAKQPPDTVLTAPPPIGFDNIAGEVRQAESCPPQGFSNFFTQTSNIPASQTQNFIPTETNPLGQPQVKDPHSFFDSFTVTRPDGVEAASLSSNSSQCSFFQPLAGDDQQQQQQQQSSKEYQSLQNFFNNPPPKESTGEAGDLNYDLVHSGLGVKDLVQRSLTPASNLVEPPSSSCSELSLNTSKREEAATETATSNENPATTTSSENPATTTSYENTATTRGETITTTRDETTTTTNEIITTTTINDASTNDDLGTNNWSFVKHYGELPEEILQDLRAMAKNDTGAASSSSSPPVVPYTPAVKHWFYRRVIDSKFVWFPFSHYDNALLETSLMSGDPEQNIVAVEGGRYDANIRERHKTPVYWDGEPLAVRRCSWFYKGSDSKYVPYEEEVADLLEAEYKLAVEKNEWHKKIILSQGEQVTLHGPTVIVHFHQQQNSDAWGGTTQVTNRPRVVKRDLDDFNIDQGESQRVDHLLLMVHGIGSACDLKMRSVEEVVDEFRSIAQQLVKSHYKNSTDLGQVGRVEVLPISWHFHLHSLESGIDEKLKSITLESIPRLRNFTNDTLLDVLFYTSPMYCQKIMNTVATAMNETYLKYRERHPEFSGGVSLAGHSLGSLILFDLLCHQHPIKELEDANVENPDEMYGLAHAQLTKATDPSPSCAHEEQVQYTMGPAGTGQPFIHYTQLAFQPKKFFALGSPIGMFVTIRGIDTLGLDFRLPTCAGFYNIFHPFDPVAYRIEALINPDMSGVRPVLVPHHKGRKRMHLELKETMTRVGADLKQRFLDTVKTTIGSVNFLGTSSMATAGGKKEEDAIKEEVEKVLTMQMQMDSSSSEQLPKQRNRTDSTSTLQSDESMVEIDVPLGKLNDSKRVDYVLQEAPLEIINEYIFALSSHVCYWESEDTILFVMKEIYTGLGITPDSQVPQQSMTIERPNSQNS